MFRKSRGSSIDYSNAMTGEEILDMFQENFQMDPVLEHAVLQHIEPERNIFAMSSSIELILPGDLEFVLKSLKKGKGRGTDEISNEFLKECVSRKKLFYWILNMANSSLRNSKIASQWLVGFIKPVPKGNTGIIEKLILRKISPILSQKNPDYQFAKKGGTQKALGKVIHTVCRDPGSIYYAIMFDISKAFDRVHLEKLVSEFIALRNFKKFISLVEKLFTRTNSCA